MKIEYAKIIDADWKNDLGRGSDEFGLVLTLECYPWTGCVTFDLGEGRTTLISYGVASARDLVGKHCMVEFAIGSSEIKYLGPMLLKTEEIK